MAKANFWGFVIGATAGLALALYKAPQAGDKTRQQIEQAGADLTRRAAGAAQVAARQALDSAQPALNRVEKAAKRADSLVSRGQAVLEERRREMRNGQNL